MELLHHLFSGILSEDRHHNNARILNIPHTTRYQRLSELGTGVFEVLIGVFGVFVGGEGDIGPGFHLGLFAVDIDDVPLRSLLLDKLLDVISEGSRVFLLIGFDAPDMEHIGLVPLGILVDFGLGIPRESGVLVDKLFNVL